MSLPVSSPSASSPALSRRDWLKAAGASTAAVALASALFPSRAAAQHEADRSARPAEPIRLSSNENPFGPSPAAIMAVLQGAERAFRYPHAETTALVEAIAAHEGVTPAHIVMGFGSADVLEGLANHLGRQGGELVTADLVFNFFPTAIARAGAKLVNVPLDAQSRHDLPAMAAAITDATRAVHVCNPNNPTGTLLPAAELRAFVLAAAERAVVIVDEAYLEFCDDYAGHTLVGLVREGKNVVVTRTFSKIHGLAGQRVGYAVMAPALAQAAFGQRALGGGFRLNMLGVLAAQASLADTAFVEETRVKMKAAREGLCAVLKGLGRTYAEPQGCFVYFDAGMPYRTFQEKMRAENIITGSGYAPRPEWARISLGLPEEMEAVHAALRRIYA